MKKASYPIHLNLTGRRVLVVGAGGVATRKVERLVETPANVDVIAPQASDKIQALSRAGQLTLTLRDAREEDVAGALLVLCATDRPEVNARLARAARAHGALVSRVDAPEESDFTVPGLARGESAEATVSTRGAAPSASRRLARELRTWLSRGPDRFAHEMAEARGKLRGHPDATERLRELGAGVLFEACVMGDESRIQEVISAALGDCAECAPASKPYPREAAR